MSRARLLPLEQRENEYRQYVLHPAEGLGHTQFFLPFVFPPPDKGPAA